MGLSNRPMQDLEPYIGVHGLIVGVGLLLRGTCTCTYSRPITMYTALCLNFDEYSGLYMRPW